MMILAAVRHAYPDAKARAMRGRRLTRQDLHYLREAPTLERFLAYLATTAYGPLIPAAWLEGAMPKAEQAAGFERRLYVPLFADYRRLALAMRGRGERRAIEALFARFEVENLKILLRAKHEGHLRAAVSHLLYPTDVYSRLDWEALWNLETVAAVVGALDRSPFGRALAHAMPQYQAQARLVPLEMALELSCFEHLKEALFSLGRRDRRVAARVTGAYVDILNIGRVIRLRFRYGFSPEETVNLMLPGGQRLALGELHDLARAQDLGAMLAAVPSPFREVLKGVTVPGAVEGCLRRWLLARLAAVFTGSAFHLGIEIAYLLERELEIQTVVALFEGKRLGVAPDKLGSIVPDATEASGYVPAG